MARSHEPSGESATLTSHAAMDNQQRRDENDQEGHDQHDHDEDDEDDDDAVNDDGPQRKYERRSKRFAWPDELHRLFVAAIFDLGLKNASPKALLPFMQPTAANAGLTTEHLKSHLQKYRLHYDKSRCEFLAFYDESNRRNGRRRRRSVKSTESHTRFIFPITTNIADSSAMATDGGSGDTQCRQHRQQLPQPQRKANGVPITSTGALPHPQTYVGTTQFGSASPRSRLERAKLLRIAQQNAAMAFASGSDPNYAIANASHTAATAGSGGGVSDAQWGILASLLSPQVASLSTRSAMAPPPAGFSLGDDDLASDLQLQMHLAMQTQMNLHRRMLSRKVEVSQNYVNHAAAVKRAAASAMVERALQNVAVQPQQQQQHQQLDQQQLQLQQQLQAPAQPRRYNNGSYHPSIGDNSMLMVQQQQQEQQQQQYQQLQQQQQQQQQHQRYATPMGSNAFGADVPAPAMSPSDSALPMPWDAMDIDMGLSSDDQTDLFSFLKTTK